MSMFGILDTAGSALRTNRVWMDAVSDNLANINTIRPFNQPAVQSRSIIVTAVRGDDKDRAGVGGGVQATAYEFGDPQGRTRYQPDLPFASAEGLVRYPDIDLSD